MNHICHFLKVAQEHHSVAATQTIAILVLHKVAIFMDQQMMAITEQVWVLAINA